MEPQRESILGLDNIRLDLPVASAGSRALAAALDYLILFVVIVVWLLFCVLVLSAWLAGGWALGVALVGMLLLEWGYFAGLEVAFGGRTAGKRALGLRVVTAEGASAGAAALLIRNLVRLVDLVVGLPLVVLDPLGRRLGDRLAGTLVVHDRRRGAGVLLGRVPPGWGVGEVSTLEAFLARAGEIERERAHLMARRLLGRVERDAPEWLAGVDRADPVAALRRALQVEEG